VDHLDHLEEVIFSKFLQAVGQFVHVDLGAVRSDSSRYAGQTKQHTFFSVFFFFFDPSSPAAARLDLTPFSSPGTGPDSRRAASRAGLGFLKV
jgi:hypothetical protein